MSAGFRSSVLASAEVWFGAGELDRLGNFLTRHSVRSCLLLTGAGSYRRSGAADRLRKALTGIRVWHWRPVPPNPPAGFVAAAASALRGSGTDAVLAVGGGSVLDAGKLVAALAGQPGPPEEYLDGTRPLADVHRPLLVLVPTTGGSGSEATSIAVTTVDGRRSSLRHRLLGADLAVVDPELTWSAPAALTASCGMDVLCHAVESYWSVASTPQSRAHAAAAIPLVVDHLVPACTRPSAREALCRAALSAGRAIEITQTTAAHALSYALTTDFGVAHGHACGVFLGAVFEHNAAVTPGDTNDARGAAFVRARIGELQELLGVRTPREARVRLDGLVAATGLRTRLADLGVRAADLPRLVDAATHSPRLAGNPRRLGRAALLDLVTRLR
ncbi:phosphonoacetaldehyde reductase [Amycolatopsis sp. MtRt-6]|uniref:phosphonoacetaldehyde reductase n=1 Tax=Amycolatopsis sp. MtRt-6 TaxID=2792782 RepID=UPI001A903A89|nr:phosphonoacetaldehyde reductase [Amycolatopsis sp. MtRt-6]